MAQPTKKKQVGPKAHSNRAGDKNSRPAKSSFRKLKAFGIWADRTDLKDPIQFTAQLRARMEHGNDSR
jgi:hypothetical protein